MNKRELTQDILMFEQSIKDLKRGLLNRRNSMDLEERKDDLQSIYNYTARVKRHRFQLLVKYKKVTYSKEYQHDDKIFRYNYQNNTLEYITYTDYKEDGDDFKEIKLNKPQVINSIGLSLEDWNDGDDDKIYWLEMFNNDMESEFNYILKEFI